MSFFKINSAYAWGLLAVSVAACLALFVSLQVGFFALLFITLSWWVWSNPEEGFLSFVILAPLLSMFKATQTIGNVTLVKDAIILVLFLRVLLWPLFAKRLSYRRSILFGPLFALGAWTAFETLRASSLSLGILRAREIVLYAMLYFVVLYLPANVQIWKRRLGWATASFLITVLHAVYQWVFAIDSAVLRFVPSLSIWIPRISSTFAQPSVYGQYVIAFTTLFLAGGIFAKSVNQRIQASFLTLISLPVIYATYSRGVWLGFVVAVGVMGLTWVLSQRSHRFTREAASLRPPSEARSDSPSLVPQSETPWPLRLRKPRLANLWLTGLGVVVLVAGIFFGLLRFTPAGSLLRSALDPAYASNAARLEFVARLVAPMSNMDAIIGRGLGDVVQQKLVGTTVGTDELAVADSREIQLAKNSTLVDNQYLKTFVEMGIIGLVIYGWLFWRFAKGALELLKPSLRQGYGGQIPRKILGIWGLGFLAAFILQALVIDIWDVFPTNAMFWIVGGLISVALTSHTSSHETR